MALVAGRSLAVSIGVGLKTNGGCLLHPTRRLMREPWTCLPPIHWINPRGNEVWLQIPRTTTAWMTTSGSASASVVKTQPKKTKSATKSAGKKRGKSKSAGSKKKGGKKSGKRSAKSSAKSSASKIDKEPVDMLHPAVMENLYYIAHDAPDALSMRGFGWPDAPKKKGKGKKGKKKKK